jgi:hypothetical protein
VKNIVKRKIKLTKPLIATTFLVTIIALVTTVNAYYPNHMLIMAIGDDIDLNATNLILGNIELDEAGDPTSVNAVFHQRIYDESGKKAYTMMGILPKGSLITNEHMFYCPIYNVWWINVLWVGGNGKFRTTDTELVVFFRNSMYLTMPNTEGKWVSASIFMWLPLTAEYYLAEFDGEGNLLPPPLGEDPLIWEEELWVLAGVFWDTGLPVDVGYGLGIFPIGPASNLTRYFIF